MKSGLAWILVLSLAANGVLLGARWLSHTSAVAPATRIVTTEISSSPTVGSESTDSAHPGESPSVAGATSTFWSSLDHGDLRAVAAALRAAGLPESDVREVIRAMIGDRFKARAEAASASRYQRPFWQSQSQFAEFSQRVSASYAVWREEEAMRADIVGADPIDPIEAWYQRRYYGPLPEEKLSAISRLERDYSELSIQARASSFGPQMPWEVENQSYIESEKRRDLEALLSPDELRLYDLHVSASANTLRSDLVAFDATEAEFVALYALQRAHDEKYNVGRPGTTSANWAAANQAKPELLAQVRAALGEDRFKDYERATDQGYRTAVAVAKRLNLPAESAGRAYDLANETNAVVKALNRDTSLTPADRAAAMGRLVDEANANLERLLTKSGAEAYRARSDRWRYVESERVQKERESR